MIEDYVQNDPTVDLETRRKTMELINMSKEDEKAAEAIGGLDLADNDESEDEELDFETRFKGIDFEVDELDDETVHKIMMRLTDEEKEEFESLIQSGKIMDLLPIDEIVKLKPAPLIEEVAYNDEDEDSLSTKGATGTSSYPTQTIKTVRGHN